MCVLGPYFRYRTFCDYFDLPFRRHADAGSATLRKFMYVPVFAVAFLAASHVWPLSVSPLFDKICVTWCNLYIYVGYSMH